MSTKYYTFYIIYLLAYLIDIKNYEIIIPFNSQLSEISDDLNSPQFIESLINNKLFTNVEIGTPPQKMQFMLDFNNYDSFVIHKNKFDNYSSSTFNIVNKQVRYYTSDYHYSYEASDLVSFEKNISNFSLNFFHVINPKNEPYTNNPGILGFGISQLRNLNFKKSFLDQLKGKKLINNYQYTLIFNDNNFNGKIIIEKDIYDDFPEENFVYDYSIFTNEYTYIYYWGWKYMSSYYNSEPLEIQNIYLRPELGINLASDKVKNIFRNKFFESYIKQEKCEERLYNNYYFFYCSKDVNINEFGKLEFILKRKNMTITFESKDLFYEYNNNLYFLIIFKGDINLGDIYLGYPFFKIYNTKFNPDSKIVGFYNIKIDYNPKEHNEKNNIENNKEDNDNNREDEVKKQNNKNKGHNNLRIDNNTIWKIILVFALIIIILIVLFISFYVYRGIKRKTKGKLFEELNP